MPPAPREFPLPRDRNPRQEGVLVPPTTQVAPPPPPAPTPAGPRPRNPRSQPQILTGEPVRQPAPPAPLTPRRPIPAANQRPNGVTDTPWTGGAFTGAKPAGFNIPDFVTGADENSRWQSYLQYLGANPGARGNRILHNMTGFNQGNGYTPRVAPGGTPTPGPADPGPIQGGPTPLPGGGVDDYWSLPWPGDQGGWGGDQPEPYAFNDPFQGALAMIPAMNANLRTNIGGAMADAGFTGNRYGTFAAERAGELGAENALAQNAMLNQVYLDYANQRENRGLQAAGQATGLGGLLDQINQSQISLPFQLGQYEQGRQDQFGVLGYQDFEQNKLGWIPMLLQAAMSQGAGSPGSVYTTQTPGSPGAADWVSLLGGLFGS